ncbi:hypothetical protein M407DRAFT_115180 [Tulasnella calospora MUT 4182]|uniref:Protein kinase domain-containing protein n=1 Tax=Tulasnella calospora MUT 4182 TaxID=1051891 RepID=A0A0C3LNC6_9AGAM|nr:hypothetical protein M407DRAFT_115180 [Tulasnella calospora MUT 4182]
MVILHPRASPSPRVQNRYLSSTPIRHGMPRGSTSTPFGVARKCFSPRAVPSLKVKKPKKHSNPGSANTSSKVPVILLGSDESRFANEIEKWASRSSCQATKLSTFHAATMASWPGAKPLNELPDYTGRVTIKGPIDTSHKLLNSYDGEVTGAPEISRVTVNVLKTVGHGLEDPHFSKWTEAVRRRLRSEIGAWMEVDGPFVHYLGFATVGGVPAVLTQSVEATSSKEHLQKLSMQEKRLMILGFAEALMALHKEELWHGNLEPQHFVVDNKGKAKLSGFCFNHMIEKELGKVTLSKEHRRSARYAAPEVLEDNTEDEKSDVYSFACVALELLTGKQPFYTTQGEDSVAQQIINGKVPFTGDYPELQDDLWWSTLKMCWSRNPEDRPPMRTVYKELVRTANNLNKTTLFGEYIILSLNHQTVLCTA